MSQPKKILVTSSHLQQIYHEALQEIKHGNPVELTNIEFVAAANLKAIQSFLSRNDVNLEFDIDFTKRSKLQKY